MTTTDLGARLASEPKATEYRQARGAALAKSKAKAFRHLAGETWLVPSATASGSGSGYVVDMAAGRCTCPDFEERGLPCKHQYAIRYFRHELEMPDGTSVVTEGISITKSKVTYGRDWPAYNAAQCNEGDIVPILLRGLCDGIVEPQRKEKRGKRPLSLRDGVYAAAMKVYSKKSARRATKEMKVCNAQRLVEHVPCYNSVYNIMERADLTPLFKKLVAESALPLRAIERDFAVDSTGFATNTYSRWYDEKYGEKKRHRWVKAHAAVGVRTNVIVAVEVSHGDAGDCPFAYPLLQQVKASGFQIREVSMDKAYLAHELLAFVEELGGVPYVPFRVDSIGTGSAAWERMWHHFSANKDDFLAHYHKRSNVESTFSALQALFDKTVGSRLPAAQTNEVLLKCLCYNLTVLVHSIYELRIEPKFWLPKNAEWSAP